MERVIRRDSYLNQLIDKKENGLIKVITGIRRYGKSYLLFNLFYDYLIESGVKEHNIRSACEFGCGEGRNSIYLAKNNIDTEAYDLSEIAIENAKKVQGKVRQKK